MGSRSVSFSPDGGTLVSGAADGTVLLRELETGNAAGLSGHGSLSSMALSPDGTLLASGYGRRHDQAMGRGNSKSESPLLKDIGPGSVPCRFLLTAPSWPPGHWIAPSGYGT